MYNEELSEVMSAMIEDKFAFMVLDYGKVISSTINSKVNQTCSDYAQKYL